MSLGWFNTFKLFVYQYYALSNILLMVFQEINPGPVSSFADCVLACGPERNCYPATCCAVQKKASPSKSAESNNHSTTVTRRQMSQDNTSHNDIV